MNNKAYLIILQGTGQIKKVIHEYTTSLAMLQMG